MARRKRASMRDGPLADLFRSTIHRGEEEPEQEQRTEQHSPAAPSREEEKTPIRERQPTRAPSPPTEPASAREEPEPGPPDPERVRAYRVDERGPLPPARDRLTRFFNDEAHDVEGPAYGREEPGMGEYHGPPRPHLPVIRVVGVGGAGVNAINRMIEVEIPGVEFMAINTDLQSLQQSTADVTVHLGSGMARGLGTGSNPELGYKAAFEEQDKIKRLLKGSDMVFVTAGVGGGTGTGAAPVIARLARDVGALNTTMIEAFQVADDVLRQGVQGISELITLPGLINLDFADVRTTMRDAGQALLGIGMGTGETRAVAAAERAVSSPLLETSVDGARSILLSITGGPDMGLLEVSEAAQVVQEAAHPDANIIFGANLDDTLTDQIWVTVIATRFDGRGRRKDGSGGTERRAAGTTTAAVRRPADRRAGTAKSFESRPRDLSIDVPEFVPGR